MKAFILSLLLLILLLAGGFFFLVYSGIYSVAAVEEHAAAERWALDTAKRASVERRAGDIEVPDLADREAVLRGAGAYEAMCATCHGAPGVERSAMGRGLNPTAPDPEDMLGIWSPADMFWITKNGIRMTGMPAWGPTHTDAQIWEIVAFLQAMEEMTPEEYEAIVAEAPGHEHNGHAPHEPEREHNRHDHDHDHSH